MNVFFLLLMLLSALGTLRPASCQQEAGEGPIKVQETDDGKRMVHVDGQPVVLTWAYGLTNSEDLEAYQDAGFNTLCVEVPWAEGTDYDKIVALVRAAGEAGLHVILDLQMAPPQDVENPARCSPDDVDYRKLLNDWVKWVAGKFADLPGVIGWATQHFPGSFIVYDDKGFQQYLQQTYQSLPALSQAWSVQLTSWRAATMDTASKLDDAHPIQWAMPSLDVALYRWFWLRNLMQLWAFTLRTAAKGSLLLTGEVQDYKTLFSVPPGYDVIVAAALPGVAETDVLAHNCQAVDMARRANQFVAASVLATKATDQLPEHAIQAQLAGWMRGALLHGAGCLAFQNWEDLKANKALLKTVTDGLVEVEATRLTCSVPRPRAAFLYSPIAEGVIANGQALYGFASGLSATDEPSRLFQTYRGGSKFGQFDYLSYDQLPFLRAGAYSTILAPFSFYLPFEGQRGLATFVQGGGVLVADLGIGMAQEGGDIRSIPPVLQQVLGIRLVERLTIAGRNMRIINPHVLLPSLPVGLVTDGVSNGLAFTGIMGEARMYAETIPVGLVQLGPHANVRPLSGSLTVHAFGAGYGVFAPFRLWADWTPVNRGYQEFHNDVLSRGASLMAVNAEGVPANLLEVAAFKGGVAALNRDNQPRYAHLQTSSANHFVFANAYQFFQQQAGEPPRIPSPESAVTALVSPLEPEVADLHLDLASGELRYCPMIPIQVLPKGGSAGVRVSEYGKDRIVLALYGNGARMTADSKGNLSVAVTKENKLRLVVYNGTYPVPPNSKHLIGFSKGGQQGDRELRYEALPSGKIMVDLDVKVAQVTITPQPEEKEKEPAGK